MAVVDRQQPRVGLPDQLEGGAARLRGQQLRLARPQIEQVEVGDHRPALRGEGGHRQLGAVGGEGHPHRHPLGGGQAPGQQLLAGGVVDGQQGQLAHVVGGHRQLAPIAQGAQIDMSRRLPGIQLAGAAFDPQLAARAAVEDKAVAPRRQRRAGVAGAHRVQPGAAVCKDSALLRPQHHKAAAQLLGLVDLPRAGLLREALFGHQRDADGVGQVFQRHDGGVDHPGQVDDHRRHQGHQQGGAPQPPVVQPLPRRLDVFDPARGHLLPAGLPAGLSHPSCSFPGAAAPP